ncbi:MAG: GH3 auxin-responsive promoter family protein, partial [Gammaproteobacteria bacterium]
MKRKFRDGRRRRRSGFAEIAGPAFSWGMARSAERFIGQTGQFEALSRKTLNRILSMNRRTAFARSRGLDGRSRRRVFETLPVTNYSDYAPYIDRTAAGEQNLLSGDSVVYFSNTSGTTGPPKMIPVTKQQMSRGITTKLTAIGLAIRAGILPPMRGRFMNFMIDHVNPTTSGGLQTGSAITGGFRKIAPMHDLLMTSPADVSHIPDQAASRYLHLLFGLGEERLWTIVSFFPIAMLYSMRDMTAHAEELLRDLADGTITARLNLQADVRRRLERRRSPDPARARKLAALLERGRFTIPDIWPDVTAILTTTGGAFRFYADQLRPHLGDVNIFSPVYSASEGTFGFGFAAGEPRYLLLPTLAYLEFLPVEDMDDPRARPIPAWEAEPGNQYEVVITTLAGFVRYRLHDIVRVLDFRGQCPIIEFIEREGHVINVSSEKTAEHHIVEAIDIASH